MYRVRSSLLMSIALFLVSFGSPPRIVVIDRGPGGSRQREVALENARQTRIALQQRQKPIRRWPGRLY